MNRTCRLLASLALLAIACAAQGREVYRCRTPDGALRFGDTPCPEGAREPASVTLRDPGPGERRRDAAAAEQRARAYEQVDARRVAELEAEATKRLPISLGGSARAARTAAPSRPPGPDPKERDCASARARRDKAYREHGNDMSFDARRRLQDRLGDACGR